MVSCQGWSHDCISRVYCKEGVVRQVVRWGPVTGLSRGCQGVVSGLSGSCQRVVRGLPDLTQRVITTTTITWTVFSHPPPYLSDHTGGCQGVVRGLSQVAKIVTSCQMFVRGLSKRVRV